MGIVCPMHWKSLDWFPLRNEGFRPASALFHGDSRSYSSSFSSRRRQQGIEIGIKISCRAASTSSSLLQPGFASKAQLLFSQIELDPEVLLTSLGASASLFSACALVAWMQKSGFLPAETPAILSQVAFRVLIPCYLMSKVARVLGTRTTGNIAVIPLIAIGQVVAGAMVSKLVCFILYGNRSSKVITKKKALVTTACSFGNALSLPTVFLNGVLPPQQASAAAGYLALYVVGWSPTLWTIAYQMLKSAAGSTKKETISEKPSINEVAQKWAKRIVNPPLMGILVGAIVGLTPVSVPIFHQKTTLCARLLHPVFDAVQLLGSAATGIQVTILACSLAGVMKTRSARLPQFWGPRKMKSIKPDLADAVDSPSSVSETPVVENRELLAIFCVRSVILPLGFCLFLSAAERLRFLVLDPICKLTLMVLSAMPTAQNLVVLAQLRSSTRPLAKELASLLLIQYTAALVPVSIWLALFLSMTNLS